MEWLCRSKSSCYRLMAHILFAFLPGQYLSAFEILSEGAMDSVSAVASGSAESLLNIAGAPAAGLVVEGFDALPYQQSTVRRDVSISDESLDASFVTQIEVWADERRQTSGSGFEIGYVEELPELDGPSLQDDADGDVVESKDSVSGGLDEEEERRVDLTIEVDERGELLPTSRFFDRSFESRASVDTDIADYSRTPGAGFVFDLGSENANRLTAIRDENKPLF